MMQNNNEWDGKGDSLDNGDAEASFFDGFDKWMKRKCPVCGKRTDEHPYMHGKYFPCNTIREMEKVISFSQETIDKQISTISEQIIEVARLTEERNALSTKYDDLMRKFMEKRVDDYNDNPENRLKIKLRGDECNQ